MATKPGTSAATFRSWLSGQQERADPVGDLARDVLADPHKPDFASLNDWRQHVGDFAAPALETAWTEYRN